MKIRLVVFILLSSLPIILYFDYYSVAPDQVREAACDYIREETSIVSSYNYDNRYWFLYKTKEETGLVTMVKGLNGKYQIIELHGSTGPGAVVYLIDGQPVSLLYGQSDSIKDVSIFDGANEAFKYYDENSFLIVRMAPFRSGSLNILKLDDTLENLPVLSIHDGLVRLPSSGPIFFSIVGWFVGAFALLVSTRNYKLSDKQVYDNQRFKQMKP